MAESLNATASTSTDEQELKAIKHLLWGPVIKTDVFGRWSQGL